MSCPRRYPRRGTNFQLEQHEVYVVENPVVIEIPDNNQVNSVNNDSDINDSVRNQMNDVKCTIASQTTPGLAKNGPPLKEVKDPEETSDESNNEEQSCPVCFEEWTNSGKHRLCSLNCGHLFGRSCIERWLKEQRNKNCPQCKHPAKIKDIRNIYAKHLKVLDTIDRDQAKKELLEEQYKRRRAEENEAKALLQCQLLKAEMERLRREVENHAPSCSTSSSLRVSNRSSTFLATPQSSCPLRQPLATINSTQLPPLSSSRSFAFQKSLQVSTKEARVMAFDKSNTMIVVSKPSPKQLFKGYGVLKVSSLDSRCSEFISIHQNVIRDAKFNNTCDRLLLTASTDKTVKISNMLSNSVVVSYTCPGPVWACAWNEANTNIMYAGIQTGECCIYDIRQTNEMLLSVRPRFGVYPIVSLAYVPAAEERQGMCTEGVLVGTLQGGWFMHKDDVLNYTDRQLLFPEGPCSGLYFEPKTRHCMLSQRPSKKSCRVTHTICSLSGDGSEINPIRANVVQQCYGGSSAQSLTRSCIFPCPDDPSRLMICAGDESSSSVIVWDGGKQVQTLTASGGTVFDILSFEASESNFLASLTETKLSFYQWQ